MLGEGHSNNMRLMAGSAAIKQRHAFSRTSKQYVAQEFSHESTANTLTRLAGRGKQPLKLQTWRSLMVQT